MKRLACTAVALVSLAATAAGADDVPSASFERFPFQLARTHVYANSGTPADKAELNSPSPNDFPPSLTIGLETGREPEGGGRFMILSRNYLRIYNVGAVQTAPYKTIQGHIAQLEKLLQRRGKKAVKAARTEKISAVAEELPDYPPRNAGHLIEAKLGYVEAPWGKGIIYITQFVQGLGETPNNEQLVCVFQGISKDKSRFVSADFQITHPAVPASAEEPQFDWRKAGEQEAAEAFCRRIEQTLDKAPDESFTPSLRAIREWLLGLKLDE